MDLRVNRFGLGVCLAVAGALLFPAGGALAAAKARPPASPSPEGTSLPWSMRDHYKLTVGTRVLYYAIETATWRILDGEDVIVDDVGFRITFADGSTLDATNLEPARTDRAPFTDEYGEGTHFWLEFPAKDGLVVRHSLMMYKERPFLLLRVALGNVGDKPVEVARITPVILGPNGVHNLREGASGALRNVAVRGAYPVYDSGSAPTMLMVQDPKRNLGLSLGVMPAGIGQPSIDIREGNGAWRGEIACAFTPPIRLDPGTRLEADPVFITYALNEASKADLYYSWAMSVLLKQAGLAKAPMSWVTVKEGATENDLCAAVAAWSGAQVAHALVPGDWEGRPGSLEGGAPRYARSMSQVADRLRKLGAAPGLTVDPVLTASGSASCTVDTPDGRRWLNLSAREGKQAAIANIKKTLSWGFDFYVVRPSAIPDEALKHFNMTRTQADQTAFAAVLEAAGGKPVLPAAASTVKPELAAWLTAAAATSRMGEFLVTGGPVRFDAGSGEALDEAPLAALAFFNGPLEFVGNPSPELARQLAGFLPQRRLSGRPLDRATASPKIWQYQDAKSRCPASALFMFPGAPACPLAAIERDPGVEVRVWHADNGQFLDPAPGTAPAAERLTQYGVAPVLDRPVLMGAAPGPGLLLYDVRDLQWDEGTGLFRGTFQGANSQPATAYVLVPRGWAFKAGKAGGGSVKPGAGPVVTFPVPPGKATQFELSFARS